MTHDKIVVVNKDISEKIVQELGYLPDNVLINNFVSSNQAVITDSVSDTLEDIHDSLIRVDYIQPTEENIEMIENIRAQMFRAMGVPQEYLKPVPGFTSVKDYYTPDLLERLKEKITIANIRS